MPLRPEIRKGIVYFRGWVAGPGGEVIKVYKTTGLRAGTDPVTVDTLRQAWEAQLVKDAAFGRSASVSFRRLARAYLDFQARSAGTIRRVERLIRHFGDTPANAIRQAEADAAVKALCPPRKLPDGTTRDVSPATKIRQVYGPLGTLFEFGAADSRRWCEARRFEKPSVPMAPPRWLTPAQVLAIEDAAAPHLRPLIRFLACTGARLSEALDLEWGDVHLANARVIFRGSKGEKLSGDGRPRVAHLPPAGLAALANLPLADDEGRACATRTGHVFRRDDGLPYVDRERQEGGQVRRAWATACRKAGLPGKIRRHVRKLHWTPTMDRRMAGGTDRYRGRAGARQTRLIVEEVFVPEHGPHNLRHSWASWFYALRPDLVLLADEGGWRGTQIIERYAHLVPPELVPEIARVWGPSHPRLGALPTATTAVPGETSDAAHA